MSISVGDKIPDTPLMYVPYSPELADGSACGTPQKTTTHKEFAGKKVAVIAVPGAFTPTCHVNHIPPFVQQIEKFESKGYKVYVIAQNDPFVMGAWRTQNKAEDKIIFATDLNLELSKALGATADLSAMGFGLRTGRYALIADNLKVTYFAVESQGALEVSSADAVLAKI